MPERLADRTVFGPDYIPRLAALWDTGHTCLGCGHHIRQGELYGSISGFAHCGPCCDAAEKRGYRS